MDSYIRMALTVCIATSVVAGGTIAYALVGNDWISRPYNESLTAFSSYDELMDFIERTEDAESYDGPQRVLSPDSTEEMSFDGSDSYSTTNVQVSGVDEADIIKTNGEFIFTVSGNCVTIIDPHPPSDMSVAAVLNETDILGFEPGEERLYVRGLFLWNDRLAVLSNVYEYEEEYSVLDEISIVRPVVNCHRAMVSVFDVGDASSPILEYSIGVSGAYLASRMIDGTVYLVAQSRIYAVEDFPLLPRIWVLDDATEFGIEKVYFDQETQCTDAYVNVMAIDVDDGRHKEIAVITGYASTIYMSPDALFLTYRKWVGELSRVVEEIASEVMNTMRTTIHKIAVDGLRLNAVATGNVGGWLLNQFSMDEEDGMLRIATTTSWLEPENCVYVLDSQLAEMGSLEGLAPSERIYAARFLGDTLYLVTFRQIDPLFVIDLRDPYSPKVLGELKIPGFSSYLHPIGDKHVLGIGSEDGAVKLSLFDVSDPGDPAEQDTYLVSTSSWTAATYDHKAVLYNPDRGMLVIPISTYYWTTTPEYGSGAWVFNISTTDGISLWNVIKHESSDYYYRVTRSLYIDDTLFTISPTIVMAHSLIDLSELGSLQYSEPEYRDVYW